MNMKFFRLLLILLNGARRLLAKDENDSIPLYDLWQIYNPDNIHNHLRLAHRNIHRNK